MVRSFMILSLPVSLFGLDSMQMKKKVLFWHKRLNIALPMQKKELGFATGCLFFSKPVKSNSISY